MGVGISLPKPDNPLVQMFVGEELRFEAWCQNNQNGCILNINAKSPNRKSINKIHRIAVNRCFKNVISIE